jgi:subtilisin family serine protease
MLNVAFHRRHTSAFLLFLLLIASSMLPVASGRAESGDYVRVIVVLRAPAAADRYDLMAPDEIAQVQEQFTPAAVAAGAREIVRLDTLPVVILDAPRSALNRLANHPLAANVVEDALAMPHLSGSVLLIHADLAQQEANGAGVAIAIVDTGVDAAHPFLGGRVIAEACFSTNNAAQGATSLCPGGGSEAFGPGAAAPCSLSNCDHGTHVAGIAAGNGGVAPGASIIAVQVFSRIANCSAFSLPSPCALSYVSDQLRAFDWLASTAFTPPLAIVNLSLGMSTSVAVCDTSPIGTAMFPAIATLRNQGVTTVVSSGNNGATNALSLPGCLSNVISVGATTKTNPEQVALFSNSAPFLTLLAPGVGIVSSTTGGGFAPKSGTSMAAPHVAGALALLRSARPGYPSDAYVTALVNTGTPILDTRNGVIKPRIDVAAALGAMPPMQKRAFLPLVARP